MPITNGTGLHIFVETLRQSLKNSLAESISSYWTVVVGDESAPQPTASESQLAFALSVSGRIRGEAAILIQKPSLLFLGQKLLKQDVVPNAELTNEQQQMVEGFLQHVIVVTQAALGPHVHEIKLQLVKSNVPTLPGTTVPLLARQENGEIALLLHISKDLADALAKLNESPVETKLAYSGNNLALLLGIDLNLTLQFGKSSLKLVEILELPTGSVIEVDRQVQEPVELLLGERVIAKGEVVVMDGNYGLRITEVPAFVAD
jgi:flagellar motor switch protein FliN